MFAFVGICACGMDSEYVASGQREDGTRIMVVGNHAPHDLYVRMRDITTGNRRAAPVLWEGVLPASRDITILRPKFGSFRIAIFSPTETGAEGARITTSILSSEKLAGLKGISILPGNADRMLTLVADHDFHGFECPFCFDEIGPAHVVCALACGHQFHLECASRCLPDGTGICPGGCGNVVNLQQAELFEISGTRELESF